MKIHYVYFSESDKHSNILEDYFAFHYPFQFSINKSNILKKHGSYLEAKTFPTFEKRLQKIGYAETKYEQCDSCSQLFKISSRSELEFLYKSLGSHCKTCREKSSYANIIEAQETYISVTDDFFYIYNNNTAFPNTQKRKKRYSYPEITTQLQSLSILDLIYLHEICDKLSFSTGRLKLKEFAIFSYAENFNDNSHIINLLLEGLLYTDLFIEKDAIYYWRLFATKKSPLASPECLEVIKRIQNETYSTFPILFIPQNYTVQGYKNLIHSIISNYTLSESDYIDISSYLTSKRLGEIKFLAKVACYNSKLKLADKNSIAEKFKQLADSLNLHEINGYFASATFRTYYKLDFVPDDQRNKLKNAIFNNYIAGNKITSWHKKTLPNNYQKSFIVDFLTSFVGMSDDSWLNLSVNDFLKVLFRRLQK